MLIRQITIIGTGLLGGSFGLALKKRGFTGKIIGCDRAAVLKQAQKMGAIDQGSIDPAKAVRGSQMVLLAAPVGAIIELIGRLGPALDAKTLLTDVGSTKAEILSRAQAAFGKHTARRFLAGHPMAGKEHAGVQGADPDLFQGAVWFVTPLPGQKIFQGASGEFLEWIEKIGASVASMEAEAHDQLCSWISHLPQFVSTALAADPGGRIWRGCSVAANRRTRAAGDDADCGKPLFHVARRCSHQQGEYPACAVEAGAASRSYPGESGYPGIGRGIRASAPFEETCAGERWPHRKDKELISSRVPCLSRDFHLRFLL